jgi:hypothetical protein
MALPDWITLTPSSGDAGTTAITATAQRHTGRYDRSATATVRTNEGNKTASVTIRQEGARMFMDVRSWDFGSGEIVDLTGGNADDLSTASVDMGERIITLQGRGNLSRLNEVVLPSWIEFVSWMAEDLNVEESRISDVDEDETLVPGYGEDNDYSYRIYLRVTANTGGARSGDFYVTGVFPPSYVFGAETSVGFTFTINQAAGYALSVDKTSLSFHADGSPESANSNKFNVTSVASGWTAS